MGGAALKGVTACRSPHGERGLKSRPDGMYTIEDCRSPHGERGLKWSCDRVAQRAAESLSSRRAWIEIPAGGGDTSKNRSRSPHGERGLKLHQSVEQGDCRASLSSRRAWIEIAHRAAVHAGVQVALLTESVD